MVKKKQNMTLAERLKAIFSPAKTEVPQAAPKAVAAAHDENDMAFKAGAAVAFMTPIGAYAGKTTPDSQRLQAEQMFRQTNDANTMTIN